MGKNSFRRSLVLGVALFLVCAASVGLAADVNSLPAPTGYIDDFAGVVDQQSKDTLEAFCTRVDHELGVQFALVTVDTVGDTPIRDFALDLGRKWKIGYKNTRQGVLLLLAIQDHKTDIETERGIEPYITDGFAGGTLRAMRPDLRANQFGAALMQAAKAMADEIARGKNIAFNSDLPVPPPRLEEPVRASHHSGFPWKILIFLLLFLFLAGRRGGGGGLFWLLPFLGGWGGGRGGGNWGGGGGFGGGNSGGGGGWGGFGGGGDFGGGGASSNW
jgi:uncharacterized protein